MSAGRLGLLCSLCLAHSSGSINNWWMSEWINSMLPRLLSSDAQPASRLINATSQQTITVFANFLLLLFSHWIMSDSLRPHGLQHARLPCPLLSPGVCSNSCPLGRWCHATIPSSVARFSSCPQSFPASESFPVYRICYFPKDVPWYYPVAKIPELWQVTKAVKQGFA